MALLLALDIGKRRTGVAFADDKKQFIMALDTIKHTNETELIDALCQLINARKIERVVIGLPLLPDGTEGEQVVFVRKIADTLQKKANRTIEFIDERYTSFVNTEAKDGDRDAASACAIASIALDQKRII